MRKLCYELLIVMCGASRLCVLLHLPSLLCDITEMANVSETVRAH